MLLLALEKYIMGRKQHVMTAGENKIKFARSTKTRENSGEAPEFSHPTRSHSLPTLPLRQDKTKNASHPLPYAPDTLQGRNTEETSEREREREREIRSKSGEPNQRNSMSTVFQTTPKPLTTHSKAYLQGKIREKSERENGKEREKTHCKSSARSEGLGSWEKWNESTFLGTQSDR